MGVTTMNNMLIIYHCACPGHIYPTCCRIVNRGNVLGWYWRSVLKSVAYISFSFFFLFFLKYVFMHMLVLRVLDFVQDSAILHHLENISSPISSPHNSLRWWDLNPLVRRLLYYGAMDAVYQIATKDTECHSKYCLQIYWHNIEVVLCIFCYVVSVY